MAQEETVRVKVDRTINPSAGLIAPTLKVSSTADGLFVPRESISEAAEKLEGINSMKMFSACGPYATN